jgi:hypothetical protein
MKGVGLLSSPLESNPEPESMCPVEVSRFFCLHLVAQRHHPRRAGDGSMALRELHKQPICC